LPLLGLVVDGCAKRVANCHKGHVVQVLFAIGVERQILQACEIFISEAETGGITLGATIIDRDWDGNISWALIRITIHALSSSKA
jgi:hypothetical protein